jgi:hypothetical protein
MTKIQSFKQELARVFDDNLHTKQWHNYVDYAIIGLIILSTVEVFLSTYDGIVEKYGFWLNKLGNRRQTGRVHRTMGSRERYLVLKSRKGVYGRLWTYDRPRSIGQSVL